jgi:hypothetical protein
MEKKRNSIQLRIDSSQKELFKNNCIQTKKSMSKEITDFINKFNNNESVHIEHIDEIESFEFITILRTLLIDYVLGKYEEFACVTDDCLMHEYKDLQKRGEVHLLFEWKHFINRISVELEG